VTNFWKKGNKLPHSEPGAVSGDPAKWLHDGGTVSAAIARDSFMVGGREVYAIRDGSSRWRKKPVEVDAWQVTYEDRWAVAAWCGGRVSGTGVVIPTLEGDMYAAPEDYVIRGVRGEFYPCKPDIFAATYEPAPDGGDASDTYRWDWFDEHDSYGVRRGSEIVHLTSRTGQGYERAVADAAALNAAARTEEDDRDA
jgi:hypothetical protein